ncbi:MAG: hypothetical protein CJBNEKGG_01644 [Prosthecobacter sp.]|nr:hypothetical protein [Prosthecobacter sp.]
MKPSRLAICCLGLMPLALPTSGLAEAVTDPVGFITINIAPGNGSTTRALTLLSAPLLTSATKADGVTPADGAVTGIISSLTSNTLTNSGAAWTAGELSAAVTPKVLRILSGAAEGRTFLLSTTTANTSTTVTLHTTETTDLTTLGIATGANGDRYQIFDCDTISSFFGDTSLIVKNDNPDLADNILLFVGGAWNTYYFHVTNNRWTRRGFGNPDATNQAVKPEAGMMFNRLGSAAMALNITGSVPMTKRADVVKSSGVTFLGTHWPVDATLATSGIQSIPGWTSNASFNSADQVQLFISGAWSKYWFDGTNWRRSGFGSPISDSQVITAGTAILINKVNASGSDSLLTKNRPF